MRLECNTGGRSHVATYYTGKLSAAMGRAAKEVDTKSSPAEQRAAQALAFFHFFEKPLIDFRDLNGDNSTAFMAIVAAPNSTMVKVVYSLRIGTSCIGQVSPVAGKLLGLFGKGGY